jgi:hypothetical protein
VHFKLSFDRELWTYSQPSIGHVILAQHGRNAGRWLRRQGRPQKGVRVYGVPAAPDGPHSGVSGALRLGVGDCASRGSLFLGADARVRRPTNADCMAPGMPVRSALHSAQPILAAISSVSPRGEFAKVSDLS